MTDLIQKIEYILIHYLTLSAFLFACWGFGYLLLRSYMDKTQENGLLEHALIATLGIGVVICILQWLAIAGELRSLWIIVLICTGILMSLIQLRNLRHPSVREILSKWKSLSFQEQCGYFAILLFLMPTFFAPLRPPFDWDECMYHLPHAQQWALSGKLSVNEWLRYPWFPFNYELLFAAALILEDDVLTHLLHAMAGWLTALIIYQFGKRYINHVVACIATIIWLQLSRGQFSNASIDMGVTLFIFSACVTFYFWLENPNKRHWLGMAAFCMGVAIGSKYQALSYLPLFVIALFIRQRKLSTFLIALFWLLIPCTYWYVRNGVATGDPFNPVGGKIFGFTDWNLDDYTLQFKDLKRHAGWPSVALWSTPLTIFINKLRDSLFARTALIISSYAFIVWLLTSHYPRYLMPVYPILALLAGSAWQWIIFKSVKEVTIFHKAQLFLSQNTQRQFIAWSILLVAISVPMVLMSYKSWNFIASTQIERDLVLSKKLSGYQVLKYLRNNPMGKTYQFGFEDAIYYGPNQIWGEFFGPWRYRDFSYLKSDELASKLRGLGFSNIVIHTKRLPQIDSQPDFNCYFSNVYQVDAVKLYRILKKNSCLEGNGSAKS
jgi:4-amino-4-deoxy-L-arabinose transferase-like glycosyltransferase